MNRLSKNKIKTAGYFIKRLRDNGFIVIKVFAFYAKTDQRRWTVLVNPGEASVFITCYQSVEGVNDFSFELNDGGKYMAKNIFLKTDSIEVIIEYLLRHGVTNKEYYPGKDKFVKKRLNNYGETENQQTAKAEQA